MKKFIYTLLLLPFAAQAQYTDVSANGGIGTAGLDGYQSLITGYKFDLNVKRQTAGTLQYGLDISLMQITGLASYYTYYSYSYQPQTVVYKYANPAVGAELFLGYSLGNRDNRTDFGITAGGVAGIKEQSRYPSYINPGNVHHGKGIRGGLYFSYVHWFGNVGGGFNINPTYMLYESSYNPDLYSKRIFALNISLGVHVRI